MKRLLKTFFHRLYCGTMMTYWGVFRDDQDMFEYYYKKAKPKEDVD